MIVDTEKKEFEYPKRIWIQISTLPEEFKGEIPVVIKDDKVLVKHIWGGDNGTYNPHAFDGAPEYNETKETQEHTEQWVLFLIKKLKDVKKNVVEEAQEEIKKMRNRIKLYSLIPD